MSCHVISCHFMSFYVISCHVMSLFHFMSCHVLSCHVISLGWFIWFYIQSIMSFCHLFVHLFLHSFIHWFIPSFICSFIYSIHAFITITIIMDHPSCMVGAFNPSEKYDFVNWEDEIPNIWENIKWCSKPPTCCWNGLNLEIHSDFFTRTVPFSTRHPEPLCALRQRKLRGE